MYYGMSAGQFKALLQIQRGHRSDGLAQLLGDTLPCVVFKIICVLFVKQPLVFDKQDGTPRLVMLWEMLMMSVPHNHRDWFTHLFGAWKSTKNWPTFAFCVKIKAPKQQFEKKLSLKKYIRCGKVLIEVTVWHFHLDWITNLTYCCPWP